MGIFKASAHRAFRDTWEVFGGWSAVIPLACIPPVGLALHLLFGGGAEAVTGQLSIWLIYGLAAAGVVFMSLFLWNFALAPYRNERDQRSFFESKSDELSELISALKDSRSFQEKLREMANRMQRFGIEYNAARPAAKDDLNFGFSGKQERELKEMGVKFQGNTSINKSTDPFQLRMITNLQNERQAYENKWWADFCNQFGGELHELLCIAKKKNIIDGSGQQLLRDLERNEYLPYRTAGFYTEMARLLRKIAARDKTEAQKRTE